MRQSDNRTQHNISSPPRGGENVSGVSTDARRVAMNVRLRWRAGLLHWLSPPPVKILCLTAPGRGAGRYLSPDAEPVGIREAGGLHPFVLFWCWAVASARW